MTKFNLLPAFALFIFICFGSAAKSQNLIVNGDLESWTAGVPDGWGPLVENITQETTIVHGGNSSAKHTSTTTSKKFNQELSGIVAGQEYTISYWYYDNDPAAKTRIWSYWLSGGTTLPDNADVLRPSVYSSDNPSWQNFNALLTAPTGADGFRFEVRVYQESGSGGGVFYDDFTFTGDITIYPEPTNYPTDFSATAAGLGINLSWTDAVGAQLPSDYIIMAGINSSLPIPSDGEPVPNDTDLSDGSGAVNVAYGLEAASFSGLEGNTTYYFTIYSYTNSGPNIDFKTNGTVPAANATTSSITTIEAENFDVSWGNWTTISVIGDQVWDRNNTYGINSTPCARISGYSGGPLDNDDWLISPAMNFDNYDNEILEFFNAKNYTGPDLECKISTDYDGGGDPYSATWTSLAFTLCPGGWAWTSSGLLDISSYNGTVYIAFHYTCNTSASATWEIDDIVITGEEEATIDPEPSNYPTDFNAVAEGLSINLTWTDAIGTQLPDKYILFAGISSSLPVPVDGIPVTNDPDLSDGSAVLNISYGIQEASFSDLLPATIYYFTIYPYTNSGVNINYKTDGVAPSDDATTENIVVVTIESENFNDSWGNWTPISVIGTQVWDRDNTFGIGSTPCASMSGYEGQAFENEDWLISPALNLNNYINETITFQNAKNYTGNDLELKVSMNYDGGGDPNSATWTNLTYTLAPSGFVWTFSGEIDLSGFNGTAVYVAFYYTSTAAASATWEVDDIEITGEEEATIFPEPSNYPTSFSADATGTTILVTWTDAIGTQLPSQYIIFAGTNSSLPLPVDGTPVADDLDLSDGSGALNVVFGLEEAAFAGLDPGQIFYFVIYPFTNTGINTDYKTDGTAPTANATTTLTPEPSNYPTGFDANATINAIALSWNDAIGGQLPEMYLIYAGSSASLPVPVDGIPVINDLDLSDGSGAINVAYGLETASFAVLDPGNTFYFVIYPYTNSGASTNYKTDGTAPAANATTLFIPEPSNYPTGFDANATSNSVDLGWTDATGSQLPEMYIIFAGTSASLPVPADGTPVPDDTDLSDGSGALNIAFGIEQASFSGLTSNTTYYFSIYPYTNSGANIDFKNDGTAPTAEAITIEPVVVTIEAENFDESWGNWTTISVTGDQVWGRDNTFGIGNTPCASMSGYEGAPFENDDWLISPALDLDNYINEVLTFQNAKNYTGNDLELKVSTDYDGGGDPYSGTWTTLTFIKSPGSWAWTPSGEIDLSGFNGAAVYIAFQFTSTAVASATWEVDDIVLTGEEDLSSDKQINLDDLFRIYPNPSNGLISIVKPGNGFENVKILSVSGSLIEEFKISDTVYNKDLSDLNAGVYFILFSDEQTGQTISKKLILN